MNEGDDTLEAAREVLTIEQRVADGTLSIDPGFVNHRKIETLLGEPAVSIINEMMHELPATMPDWQREVRIDHIYTKVLLKVCETTEVQPLGVVLTERRGTVFCSVERTQATPEIYESERAVTRILTPGFSDIHVEMHYSTAKIRADTTRSELYSGDEMAIIGEARGLRGNTVIIHPLVLGSPWLSMEQKAIPDAEWYSYEFFQNFVDDIDEFSLVRTAPRPADISLMRKISERAFKTCLGEILGDNVGKDWGGETSDHFSAHVRLGGRRVTAAFLLKGPARFAPMGLNHLGKNNDQIYRLSQEPAEFLILQHCHDVLPAVRATLRAFAVQPGRKRRYCIIDGYDSLRLLQAYGKVERALQFSA